MKPECYTCMYCPCLVDLGPISQNSDNMDNFPSPKTILGVQYSPIAMQFLVTLKAKF